MQTFTCEECGNRLYFENVTCMRCGHTLGFDSRRLRLVTLRPIPGTTDFRSAASRDRTERLRYCQNSVYGTCNWLTRADENETFCIACSMNRTIPNLTEPGNLPAWQEFERAKKRLVYQLLRFSLPLDGSTQGSAHLTFDFARGTNTGHLDGVISVDMLEADAVWREQQKQMFEEAYRSLLGHLRHESGHFYWMLLIDAAGRQDAFRALFGDERSDYATALSSYHATGPVTDWQERHVSAYACAHPWEDWAETWAHYLHMVDALETAETWGLEPRARGIIFGAKWPFKTYDVYRKETFEALMERWVPLTLALNSLSRSFGHADYYPFVISSIVREKLAFVHDAIRKTTRPN